MTLTRPWALGAGLLFATLGLAAAGLAWWLPSTVVTVMVAEPTLTAVTTPLSTAAMAGLSLLQVTF